ncbi:MAG: hypothetical protein V1743_05010 [Nanoarchaeota archaeon]
MFTFEKEQAYVTIDGITFGGQPGEYPTVLFGGVRTLTQENRDDISRELQCQAELSERFGIPCSVDLFIRKKEHIAQRLDFVAQAIPGPFLLDLPFAQLDLKRATLAYAVQAGLQGRIIYNSINAKTTAEEAAMINEYGIRSAVLLALDMSNMSTDGSLHLLERHLLPAAAQAGIEHILVDPGTLPFDNDNVAGNVLRSLMKIKLETGLPVGCAMINLVESWTYFTAHARGEAYTGAVTSLNAAVQLAGADFLIYGPVGFAERIFPSVAMMDKLISEANTGYFGIHPKTPNHPRFKA